MFMKHHNKLCIKNGVTNLSFVRALVSSPHIIDEWFDQYQSLLEQLEIAGPSYIWNIDDHGLEDSVRLKAL